MKGFIANTDREWFSFLRGGPPRDEVNFWQPSGGRAFRAIPPGAPLIFRLKIRHGLSPPPANADYRYYRGWPPLGTSDKPRPSFHSGTGKIGVTRPFWGIRNAGKGGDVLFRDMEKLCSSFVYVTLIPGPAVSSSLLRLSLDGKGAFS